MTPDEVTLSIIDHGSQGTIGTLVRGFVPRVEIEVSKDDDDGILIDVQISGGVESDELAEFLHFVADAVGEMEGQ